MLVECFFGSKGHIFVKNHYPGQSRPISGKSIFTHKRDFLGFFEKIHFSKNYRFGYKKASKTQKIFETQKYGP